MDVLSKVVTAIKGGLSEAGDAIVDSQALRILDQEIREAAEEVDQSRDALASTIARQKLSEGKIAQLNSAIDEHETYAVKALEKADESLALEVASTIATLESKLNVEVEACEGFTKSANKQRNAIALAEKDVQYMRNQLDTVKATENVQRAEAAVSKRQSGNSSKLRTAMESLERIKEKQAMTDAQRSAAIDITLDDQPSSLHRRLEEAGIIDSNNANDVLKRIRKKSS